VIEGKRIKIRPLKERDLKVVFPLLDPQGIWGPFLPKEIQSEYLFQKEFLNSGLWEDQRGMAILEDKEERPLGSLWFFSPKGWEGLEIQYLTFDEEDRGKGIMSEALSLFCAYLFATRKINRIQVNIPDFQRSSIRVLQKTGFTFEGISRQSVFHKGNYLDLCVYSLLRSECKNIEKL